MIPYGTPQPTPERQFPVTLRLKGGGGERDTGIIRHDPRKLPLHVLTGEPGGRLEGAEI